MIKVYLILRKPRNGESPAPPTVHVVDDDDRQIAFPVSRTLELIHELIEIGKGRVEPITLEQFEEKESSHTWDWVNTEGKEK
jgi:hypothetical protein